MRKLSIFGVVLFVGALALLVTAPGCGKKPERDGSDDRDDEEKVAATTKAGRPADGGGSTSQAGKVAVKAESFDGVLKGQVTYDGTPPAPEILEAVKKTDQKACRAAPEWQQINQRWIINQNNKGVANVVISLRPPDGQYFPMDKSIEFKKEVEMDQPFCAFVPHVQVVFPVYWDGKKHVPTGQTFKVKNGAAFPHNANYQGDPRDIGSRNITVQPGNEELIPFKKPSRRPVNFSCQFHPWMSAVVWVFDHPYAAISDRDGNFEIKSIPTGVELNVVAWHESPGEFKTSKLRFEKGKAETLNLTVK